MKTITDYQIISEIIEKLAIKQDDVDSINDD